MSDIYAPLEYPGKFVYLLGSLLGLLIAGSFVGEALVGRAAFNVMLGFTLIASIYAVSRNRRYVFVGATIATLTFINAWLAQVLQTPLLGLSAALLSCIFFLYTATVIVIYILKAPAIKMDEILAAVCAYLLLGISGGFIFHFLEQLDPSALISTSVHVTEISARSPIGIFIYYSFTCLTTLGFGDIIPGTPQARVFSYLAAVIGQMFLTILIARFVGLHISQYRRM